MINPTLQAYLDEYPPTTSYGNYIHGNEVQGVDEDVFTPIEPQHKTSAGRAKYLKKQKIADDKIKKAASNMQLSGKAVGFQGKEAGSFSGGKVTPLDKSIAVLLTNAKLIPFRADFFDFGDGLDHGNKQQRVKERMGMVLSALVVNCNACNGYILVASREGGLNVSHDYLRLEVANRHAVYISRSCWYDYMKLLVKCGYFRSTPKTVCDDGHAAVFHAEASHKELTPKLMEMLGGNLPSVQVDAAKNVAKLKLSGKSYTVKSRYPHSRYRQNGDLRQNMVCVTPSQALLDLVAAHHRRETYTPLLAA